MPKVPSSSAVAAVPVIQKVTPPPRKRKTKQTLPDELLVQLAENLSSTEWLTNGVSYDGEEGEKNATTEARIYRRDLSRYLKVVEREIRTRVWQDEDGFHFALMRRAASA